MSANSISPLIAHTVETRSGTSGFLPSLFWPLFTLVHYVHRYTYWKAKFERAQENYGAEYVPGGIIQLVWGENETVKVLAKVNEVALHTLHAIEDLRRLKTSFSTLYELATTQEEYYHPLEWDSYTESGWISLSTRIWVQEAYHRAVYKTRLVADCVLNIIVDSYLLSRDLMYAEFAWEGHPFQVAEAGAHLYDMKRDVEHDLLKGLGIQVSGKPTQLAPPEKTLVQKVQTVKKMSKEELKCATIYFLAGTLIKIVDYIFPAKPHVLYPPPKCHPFVQISVRKFSETLQ